MDFIKGQSFSMLVLFVLVAKTLVVSPNYADAVIFAFAALNYAHKRWEQARREEREARFLDQNLTSMQNQIDMIKADHSKLVKITEEARKALTDISLAGGFTRPKRQ